MEGEAELVDSVGSGAFVHNAPIPDGFGVRASPSMLHTKLWAVALS